MSTYRNCTIECWPPPIPSRAFDWHWAHEGFDGPGDPRSGDAASEIECRLAIDEMYEEHYEECGGNVDCWCWGAA